MVATFLTSKCFLESARSLDKKRLGKQRVEAYQILNLIHDLTRLSYMFQIPISNTDLKSSITNIWNAYKKVPYYLCIKSDGTECLINRTNIKSTQELRIVKLGYAHHPIVRQWFFYPDALKDYINAHIYAWIERGCLNTMKTYSVPQQYIRPMWTFDENVHTQHKKNLLQKEIDRNEEPWYRLRF